ncbi:chromosome segregation ATPase [Paenibacillus sp. IB182496]|uniref:Chromosome segregation ATPase n=1 Tax=Paenibacillus sabuli TaxID=2772509 RepID=A0A927BWC0_9BACL|nr:chromosome segregation ATPase [Paenibacillus sabuli]MBD2848066.1 chromosome segregation ATPase [Paenibacillus sabuli]
MPAISKIRFTHVLYEGGNKRYNDETFLFDGHNGAIVLENGGGKTVFIQTALQALLPHTELAGRKLKDTLLLENGPAHVAIEWILNDKPRRRYAVTCVSLFLSAGGLDSYRYAYAYGEHDPHSLEHIPFVKAYMGKNRPADKGEIQDYYAAMVQRAPLQAQTFATIKAYKAYLEEQFQLVASEWEAVAQINSTEGGIESFFDACKTTSQLVDRLLIPTVESAMEGFAQGSFAELFQTHREGFRRYKALREQIEENKLILQELGQYGRLYEGLHRAGQRYDAARATAKAYRQLAERHLEEQRGEQTGLAEQRQQWTQRQERLHLQLQSLELAEAGQEQAALEAGLAELREASEALERRLRHEERVFYSLKYAEQRVKLEEAGARLGGLQQRLARLEQTEDQRQLQARWEHTGGALRTVLDREERALADEQESWAAELGRLRQEQAEQERALAQHRADLRTWELELGKKQTQIEGKQEQRQQIARAILANSALEKVETQMPIWSRRQQELEDKRVEQVRSLKQMTEEQRVVRERGSALEEDIRVAEREQAVLEQRQAQSRAAHEALIRDLAELYPGWERLASVYDKEASVTQRLLEGIGRRQEQKAGALQKERLAYRYVDDYDEQTVFFADPVVARLLDTWGRQLSLLQSGTAYARGLSLDETARSRAEDRLWAVTLVTTAAEKPELLRKLAAAGRDLAYPIRVLSTAEAAAIMQGGAAPDAAAHWAVPAHWRDNEDEQAFRQWKSGLLERAGQTRAARERMEEELARWQRAEARLREFLRAYPLAHAQQLEQELQAVRERVIRHSAERERQARRDAQLGEDMDRIRAESSEMQDMIHQLGAWLKDGLDYMRLGTEQDKLERELTPVKGQIAGAERQLRSGQYRLDRVREEADAAELERQDAYMRLQVLRSDELYRLVQDFAYAEADGSGAELREAYRALEQERAGLMKERGQLEAEQEHERERCSAAEAAMRDLLLEHPELDAEAPLPIEPEARKQAGWRSIRQLRAERSAMVEQVQRQQARLQTQEGRIALLLQQFGARFPQAQPQRYEDELPAVRARLDADGAALEQEDKAWRQRSEAVERLVRELERVLQLWDKHELLHRLTDDELPAAPLEAQDAVDFAYDRTARSERSIAELQDRRAEQMREQERVGKGRDGFRQYCLSRIKDVKLRQMAIQGIEQRESYEEVMAFRQTMETRIQKAIHVAEETVQTYDRDLQQFIQRIHTHLAHIVQELKELPKKTRIKAADGWREIYSISIPEWTDQDGKDRVRTHIEWILAQLERAPQADEPADIRQGQREREQQEQDQQSGLRKSLEKWLDSRQLLQVVLKGEAIKVTCRKVTNDHQITRAAYSWEQSNRWSGGEKWSKNMTLFLGLLNYVAERRQYIQTHMKLHRAVILDNPFGKASSDHVLSPVFFIAEQLGFQILALTAHAEGKFLQDYFPIVYSCRLRGTADAVKQVIEPTQRVQHAYFRDRAPETLTRIDSRVDQLELF